MLSSKSKTKMKRYKTYKDSGVKWIGEIPSHWKTRKIKYIFTEKSEKGYPDEPVLCSTQKYGVIPQSMYENRVVVVNKGLEGLKLVRKGEFVISLRSFQGGIEYAHYQGIISAAYTILKLNEGIDAEYMKYLLKSFEFIQLLQTCVTGIREGQNINYALLRKNYIALPSFSEQRAIVSFLDTELGKIDTYLSKEQQLIDRLKELKQSVIARAVTRGINHDAKMKPSGISWIDEVPSHWKKCRNKDIMHEKKELVGDKANSYTLLSLTTNGVIVRDTSEGKGKFPKDFTTYKIVHPNNIVFCLFDVDETPRTVGLVHNEGMLTGAYDVFELHNVSERFIYYYYESIDDRKALKSLYRGLRKTIPMPSFMSMPIYLPSLDEQESIVEYITSATTKIDKLIVEKTYEMEYMKELRQRVISDAVTGKIDVRIN